MQDHTILGSPANQQEESGLIAHLLPLGNDLYLARFYGISVPEKMSSLLSSDQFHAAVRVSHRCSSIRRNLPNPWLSDHPRPYPSNRTRSVFTGLDNSLVTRSLDRISSNYYSPTLVKQHCPIRPSHTKPHQDPPLRSKPNLR